MVTHWESSRRPLYVRTVWQDGHHHVILDDTKGDFAPPPIRPPRRRPIDQGDAKDACPAMPRANKPTATLSCRPKTWTESRTKPGSLEETESCNVRGRRPTNLPPRCEDDVETRKRTSRVDDSLSERVLVWLDLAGRREECAPSIRPCRLLEKCATVDFRCRTPSESGGRFLSDEDLEETHGERAVTSELEIAPIYDRIGTYPGPSRPKTKRQLHIFIPSVSRKLGDVGLTSELGPKHA